jgi:hypothetical protein
MIAELVNIIRGERPAVSEEDQILKYYRAATPKPLKVLRELKGDILSTVTQGLGDTMMLTDLPVASAKQGYTYQVFSPSRHFLPLMSFNSCYKEVEDKAYMLNAPDLIRQYDCGNGHYLQRIRRAYGLQVDDKPHGFLKWSGQRNRQKVILHFDPGAHARWQRKKIHPRARMIYPKTRKAIEEFVAGLNGWQFVEVGDNPLQIAGTKHIRTETTAALVNLIAGAEWFIGIMSGPMHVATALGLKCVVIVNFPDATKIFLPTLKATGQVESEWFYSQHVHLHQDGEGPLVKQATTDNLKRAFNGELYPFWNDKYGALIHEKL